MVCSNQIVLARLEGGRSDSVGVGAQVDAALETALFAEGGDVGLFWDGGYEDGYIVTEDTGEDHNSQDRK